MTELPFHDGQESPATLNGARGRGKCRRHEWYLECDCRDHDAEEERDCCCNGIGRVCWVHPISFCRHCHKRRDPAASRRGRAADRLGKDQERRIERVYGPRKVGEFGDAVDHLGRDFKWQSKATRSLPPKWLAEIGMPTFREQVPEYIWQASGHMTGIGGTRRPLVIRSYVHTGIATRDWIFVQSWDWLQLHGFGMRAGWIILPGADFLEIHGRDEE